MKPAPVPRWVRLLRSLPLLGVPFFAILISPTDLSPTEDAVAGYTNGAAAFLLDANPSGNTATSLGEIDTCARIDLNGIQDADESSVDTVTIDIAVMDIPPAHPMVGFSAVLNYPESDLTVTGAQLDFLLGALPGSSIFNASNPTPDSSGQWITSAADISTSLPAPYESGSGVLVRVQISAAPGASTGLHPLTLTNVGHLDEYEALTPEVRSGASLAIDTECTNDADADGVYNLDEAFCGADPFDAASRPERVDQGFAGADDNGDGEIDEPLSALAAGYDCDGDGYTGAEESHIYISDQGDQDPCGADAGPAGWPADIVGSLGSDNRVTVIDVTSFLAPVRYIDTDVGTNPGDARWDVQPGATSVFHSDINVTDMTAIILRQTPMLDGQRAYGGPDCPWP